MENPPQQPQLFTNIPSPSSNTSSPSSYHQYIITILLSPIYHHHPPYADHSKQVSVQGELKPISELTDGTSSTWKRLSDWGWYNYDDGDDKINKDVETPPMLMNHQMIRKKVKTISIAIDRMRIVQRQDVQHQISSYISFLNNSALCRRHVFACMSAPWLMLSWCAALGWLGLGLPVGKHT